MVSLPVLHLEARPAGAGGLDGGGEEEAAGAGWARCRSRPRRRRTRRLPAAARGARWRCRGTSRPPRTVTTALIELVPSVMTGRGARRDEGREVVEGGRLGAARCRSRSARRPPPPRPRSPRRRDPRRASSPSTGPSAAARSASSTPAGLKPTGTGGTTGASCGDPHEDRARDLRPRDSAPGHSAATGTACGPLLALDESAPVMAIRYSIRAEPPGRTRQVRGPASPRRPSSAPRTSPCRRSARNCSSAPATPSAGAWAGHAEVAVGGRARGRHVR